MGIKSRRMRLVGHVARMGALGTADSIWLESLKIKYHSEDLGIDGS